MLAIRFIRLVGLLSISRQSHSQLHGVVSKCRAFSRSSAINSLSLPKAKKKKLELNDLLEKNVVVTAAALRTTTAVVERDNSKPDTVPKTIAIELEPTTSEDGAAVLPATLATTPRKRRVSHKKDTSTSTTTTATTTTATTKKKKVSAQELSSTLDTIDPIIQHKQQVSPTKEQQHIDTIPITIEPIDPFEPLDNEADTRSPVLATPTAYSRWIARWGEYITRTAPARTPTRAARPPSGTAKVWSTPQPWDEIVVDANRQV